LIVGISQPAVSDLIKREVLKENSPVGVWILDYCAHLREQAAGRMGADTSLDLVTERARLAKEQADKVAYQNAVTRGELSPTVLLEEVLAKGANQINGILDAIPGNIRRRVPSLKHEEVDLITVEIARCRNAISQLTLADLADIEPDNEGIIEV
jgi:phage terminase Nu1 subunit (DNA packaging protein)